jgi:hypothetical protein
VDIHLFPYLRRVASRSADQPISQSANLSIVMRACAWPMMQLLIGHAQQLVRLQETSGYTVVEK